MFQAHSIESVHVSPPCPRRAARREGELTGRCGERVEEMTEGQLASALWRVGSQARRLLGAVDVAPPSTNS